MSEAMKTENIQFMVHPAREAGSLDVDLVMGVTVNGATPLQRYDYDTAAHRGYALRQDTLPAAAVRGIYALFERFYTEEAGRTNTELETYMLMRAIHFGENALRSQERGLADLHLVHHQQPTLEPGGTYTLSNADNEPRYQTVVGLNNTPDNLAILGENKILAITRLKNLSAAIGTTLVHEAYPTPLAETYPAPLALG